MRGQGGAGGEGRLLTEKCPEDSALRRRGKRRDTAACPLRGDPPNQGQCKVPFPTRSHNRQIDGDGLYGLKGWGSRKPLKNFL